MENTTPAKDDDKKKKLSLRRKGRKKDHPDVLTTEGAPPPQQQAEDDEPKKGGGDEVHEDENHHHHHHHHHHQSPSTTSSVEAEAESQNGDEKKKKKKKGKKKTTKEKTTDENQEDDGNSDVNHTNSAKMENSPSAPPAAPTAVVVTSSSSTSTSQSSSATKSPLSPRKALSPRKESGGTTTTTSSSGAAEQAAVVTRKRSDTTLNDFEEVLDVVDEEGLTDDQVYISKILRGIRKGAMYGETLGKLQREAKDLERIKEEERAAAEVGEGFIVRDYKDKVTFKFSSPTPAGSRIPLMKKDKVVIMTDFAPKIFSHIRRKCNVSTEDYLKSWTYPKENLPSPNLGAGRSGSLFLNSSDARFIFKTIPEHEVETLLDILPAIHRHYVAHPESRIIRFLGLHHFYDTATKEETHCIVMNNLLLHPSFAVIDEKWDLKGRIPKPGTFQPNTKKKLKRPPFNQFLEGKEGRFADKVDRSKKVLKDNDLLKRRFYLSEEMREHLLQVLFSDVEFLKTHNCMDYSLLVGVHFLKDNELGIAEHEKAEQKAKEEKKKKKGKKGKKKSKKSIEEKEREDGEPALLEGVMEPIYSNTAITKEVYFVGIIDPLSRYKLRKKVANFLKERIWEADTLSTVPADYYANRYNKYLSEIFRFSKLEDKEGEEDGQQAESKEKTVKSDTEEQNEKKSTKRERKKSKPDEEDSTEVVAAAAVTKEDEEHKTKGSISSEKEVEVKVEEKKNGTLKKKKKKKDTEAESSSSAAENGGSTDKAVAVQPQPAPEVEIKIDVPKKEKKSKKKGDQKTED